MAKRRPAVKRQLFTVTEAGARLGVSRATAYRLVADRELDVVDVAREGSKKTNLRVSQEAIDEFIRRRTLAAA